MNRLGHIYNMALHTRGHLFSLCEAHLNARRPWWETRGLRWIPAGRTTLACEECPDTVADTLAQPPATEGGAGDNPDRSE